MGVAIYPRIENTTADWVHEISGKALAKAREKLFHYVKKDGYKDLMDYFVASQEDLDEWNVGTKAETVWFNPMEGVALIEAMTKAFGDHREEFEFPVLLERDLESFRRILDRAASEGLGWNLGIRY